MMKKLVTGWLLLFSVTGFALTDFPNQYVKDYGYSEIVPVSRAFPYFTQGDFRENRVNEEGLEVIVTSMSAVKLKAAKKIFNEHPQFKYMIARFTPLSVNSLIAEQPLGLENAKRGALNRIRHAKKVKPKGKNTYYVSIENFFTHPTALKPRDHALVIIENPRGKQFVFLSDGVEMSKEIYSYAINDKTLTEDGSGAKVSIGTVMHYEYGVDKADWVNFVVEPKYSREQQILSAFKHLNQV